jgi:branched-chain amino acid transport system substrate-binding protein
MAVTSLLCMFLSAGVATAQDEKAQEDKQKKEYGKTPEELRPFARFKSEPYKRFFVEPLEFLGPGREKPEPDVDTVRIGLIAPLEMSHEDYIGRPMLWGAQMAIDEANAGGGYEGKPFALVVRNDTGLWGASANEVVGFSYEDKVWAIIGTVDGANTHIGIRVALKTEVPVVNVADTDPTLVETKIPWIFRNVADDRQMAYTLLYYLYKERGYKRVAIFRADNRYGRFGVGEFRSGSVRLGKPAPIEINYEVNYENLNPDFSIQMERLEKVQPEAVVLWADAEAAGHIVKTMRARGLNMPIFASERVVNPVFLEIAGEAAEGVIATYPYNPDADIPALKAFKRNYRERFGVDPDTYAAHSYDGTNMVIDAIRRAGLNRYLIRDALAAMKSYSGVTGEIPFDDVYADRGPIVMVTVRGGMFVFNEPKPERVF